jgi:hypothetical protein
MDLSWQYNFLGHQQPKGRNKQEPTTFILHNKQEPTTFILPYGSNKQHCMDKEEFHWVFGVLQGWFSAKLGSKISHGSKLLEQFLGPPTATGT